MFFEQNAAETPWGRFSGANNGCYVQSESVNDTKTAQQGGFSLAINEAH